MGTKVLRHWKGAVWDNARTSVVRLLTPEAFTEKIAYTLANPVLAGAVRHAHQWAGAKNLVNEIGGVCRQIQRPHIYFASKNRKWPQSASLQFKLPPMIANAVEFRRMVSERIANAEKRANKRNSRQRNGKKHRAATISPYKRATSDETQFTQNSTFAVGQGNEEVYFKAITALKSFRLAYRKALAQWQTGNRAVTFPKGTWWMREFHAANIDGSIDYSLSKKIHVIASHTEL
jgi:putative transposase